MYLSPELKPSQLLVLSQNYSWPTLPHGTQQGADRAMHKWPPLPFPCLPHPHPTVHSSCHVPLRRKGALLPVPQTLSPPPFSLCADKENSADQQMILIWSHFIQWIMKSFSNLDIAMSRWAWFSDEFTKVVFWNSHPYLPTQHYS